jgi:hypothetical protein
LGESTTVACGELSGAKRVLEKQNVYRFVVASYSTIYNDPSIFADLLFAVSFICCRAPKNALS